MTLHYKVIWAEGMFVRPQHFQQQDRYFEFLLSERLNGLIDYNWGLIKYKLDTSLFKLGKIALSYCSGVLLDGTPFDIPAKDDSPLALSIPNNTQNQIVYLALPLSQLSIPDVLVDNQTVSRYQIKEYDINDTISSNNEAVRIPLAKPNFRLMLEQEDKRQFACLPLVRIREVTNESTIFLDENFIPPCLDYQASPRLLNFVNEIQMLLHSRADTLAKGMGDINRSNSAIGNFLMLQLINRHEPLLIHLQQQTHVHPERIYSILLQLAGELATFTNHNKRPNTFKKYHHHDLQNTFDSLIMSLRNALSVVIEESAFTFKLEKRDFDILVATIEERKLFDTASFVLAISAKLPTEMLLSRFPAQIKIGPVESIRQLITKQLPGIKLTPLSIAPPQIPYNAGYSYFKLEFTHNQLQQMKESGGVAFHVSGVFPDLQIEFWGIREKL